MEEKMKILYLLKRQIIFLPVVTKSTLSVYNQNEFTTMSSNSRITKNENFILLRNLNKIEILLNKFNDI